MCGEENGMVVYSINDLEDDNSEEHGFHKISMMTMMMTTSDRLQRSFGMPLGVTNALYGNSNVESPTLSTRRGERTRIRERNKTTHPSGSFQMLSPVAVHYKPGVKRKEAKRSCFRHAPPTSLRGYSGSMFPSSSDYFSAPTMLSSNHKKKVVRFCDDVRSTKFYS